jgi:hypothetical protein
LDILAFGLLRGGSLELRLWVHPELRIGFEPMAKAKGGITCDHAPITKTPRRSTRHAPAPKPPERALGLPVFAVRRIGRPYGEVMD